LEIGLVLAVLLLCLLATLGLTLPSAQFIRDLPHSESKSSQHAVFEAHDLLMIGLLAAIALRSLVWTSFTWIVEGQSQSLLLLSAAAAAGKLLGGPMADRFGWRRWSVGALIGAATLAVVGSNHPALMCLSAALLQSATPATVAALLTWLPGRPALASGLAFGVAIAFGGAPFAFGFGMPLLATPVTVAAIALTVLCTFLLVPRTRSQPLIKLPHPAIIHDRSRT
jgi:FSR family fosmidomycin resistance protein-like MFS transporter